MAKVWSHKFLGSAELALCEEFFFFFLKNNQCVPNSYLNSAHLTQADILSLCHQTMCNEMERLVQCSVTQ